MTRTFVEGEYEIEVSSSQSKLGWSAIAKATALRGATPVPPISTIAYHGSAEEAERVALSMLRARINGAQIA